MYHWEWPGAVSVTHRVGRAGPVRSQFTHSSVPSVKCCSFQTGSAFFTSSTSRAQISNASCAMRGADRGDQRDVTDRQLPDPVADRQRLDARQGREPRRATSANHLARARVRLVDTGRAPACRDRDRAPRRRTPRARPRPGTSTARSWAATSSGWSVTAAIRGSRIPSSLIPHPPACGRRRRSDRAGARAAASSTAMPSRTPPGDPGKVTTTTSPIVPGDAARQDRGRHLVARHRAQRLGDPGELAVRAAAPPLRASRRSASGRCRRSSTRRAPAAASASFTAARIASTSSGTIAR